MTAKVFVDTNVLVYSRDASEPHKQAQAMAWMAHLWHTKTGKLSYSDPTLVFIGIFYALIFTISNFSTIKVSNSLVYSSTWFRN